MESSRKYIESFFRQNKITACLTMLVYIAHAIANIIVSGYLQILLDAVAHQSITELNQLLVMFGVLIVGLFLLMGIKYWVYPKFLEKAMIQYRDEAFQDLLAKNIATFSREKMATYLSAFTNDMIMIQDNYLKNIFHFIQMCIFLIGSLGLMFFYSVSLTIIAIVLSFLPLVVSIAVGNKLADKEKKVSESNEVYVSTFKDILSGFNVIKTFQAEKDVHQQFDKMNRTVEANKKSANQIKEVITGMGELTSVIAQIGVLLVGAYFVIGKIDGVTIGVVVAFTNLMNFVIQPLAMIPEILAERSAAKKLIAKLSDYLHVNEYINEGQILEKTATPPMISIQNVSYEYSNGKQGLKDISMELFPGKSYGIVGSSGSGKSTLLNVLMKSNHEYQGAIRMNQHELKEISFESLYQLVSLIQQEVFLFDTTIENNVTMFKEFPQEKLDNALELSGLASLIAEKGKDYTVGENGQNLSGGERQRVAIARALLREHSIILVDEVTSALDNLTAQQINQTLFSLKNKTRIIVTHRLEEQVLNRFDKIFVMKQGALVEVGDFQSLMAQKGYFYSLYTVEN